MAEKNFFKKFFTTLIVLFIATGLFVSVTGCKVETSFGELVICESLNQDTFEPVNPKNEYEMSIKQINATINLVNIRGTDSYRFVWKNSSLLKSFQKSSGSFRQFRELNASIYPIPEGAKRLDPSFHFCMGSRTRKIIESSTFEVS